MNRPAPYRFWIVAARLVARDEEHLAQMERLYHAAMRSAKAEEKQVTAFTRKRKKLDRLLATQFAVLSELQDRYRKHLTTCPHPDHLRSPHPSIELPPTEEKDYPPYCTVCGSNL